MSREDDAQRFVQCDWSENRPDACVMCSGEVCALCGAGCALTETPCSHDVIDLHQEQIGRAHV